MLNTGTVLQTRYRIVRVLGQGGMGAVYQAQDMRLQSRLVAVKENMLADSNATRQFSIEANLLARLTHPSLPRVTDFFAENQRNYLVMDHIEGLSLDAIVQQKGPLPESQALAWIEQILYAAQYLHTNQIIHRDIKPNNIIITPQGLAVLVDFGIAKIHSAAQRTVTGARAVSPGFAPPEQYGVGSTDGRSDIYALGATLYMILTGKIPPEAPDQVAGVEVLIPPRQLNPSISERTETAILRALALRSDQRWQTIADFQTALMGTTSVLPSVPRTSLPTAPASARIPVPTASIPASPTSRSGPVTKTSHPSARNASRIYLLLRSISAAWTRASHLSPFFGCISGISATIVLILVIGTWLLAQSALLSNIASWALTNWMGIALALALIALTTNRTAIIEGLNRIFESSHRPAQQPRPKRPEVPPTPFPSTPKEKQTVNLPPDHPSMPLKHVDWISHAKKPVIEELILQEDFERLKSFIVESSGGRFLLTGYGRFGGTSLVRGAMTKAQRELEQRYQRTGVLLSFYCNVKEKLDGSGKFDIEANEFSFGTLTPQTASTQIGSSLKKLESHADRSDTSASDMPTLLTYQFALSTPLRESFFKKSRLTGLLSQKNFGDGYDIVKLSTDLNAFFDSGKKNSDLQELVLRLLQSQALPSRVLIILDRITRLETLETLAEFDLFKNERISVIALSRKEDFDGWEKGEQRLNAIGFKKWYVPCLWQTGSDYIQRIDQTLLGPSIVENQDTKRIVQLFRKHLEFAGKGALGNVLEELKHPQYWTSDGKGSVYLRLDALPHRATILHNAWMQDMLSLNWDSILAHRFTTDEMEDRARIATYYVANWIAERQAFAPDEVLGASRNFPIRVSNNPFVEKEIISNLLQVMEQNQYISMIGRQYRVDWKSDQHPRPRQVTIESSLTFGETTASSSETPVQDAKKGGTMNRKDQSHASNAAGNEASRTPLKSSASFQYDVFVSYSHKDGEWVRKHLLPPLEHAGMRICIDYRTFEIGVPSLVNMENAVRSSRKTLLVITPSWLASEWTDFEALLVQTTDPVGRRRSIVPLMVQACTLPNRLWIFTHLDLTDSAKYDQQIIRLVATLASAPD